MQFVITDAGEAAVNLDAISHVVAMSDGTARFYYGPGATDYHVIDCGSTLAEAKAAIAKITQAFDGAAYV